MKLVKVSEDISVISAIISNFNRPTLDIADIPHWDIDMNSNGYIRHILIAKPTYTSSSMVSFFLAAKQMCAELILINVDKKYVWTLTHFEYCNWYM